MRVILIGASKGGVGKSTFSAGLAVEAVRRGKRAAILDLDTVQCLARWHDLRGSMQNKDAPYLIEERRSSATGIQLARKQRMDYLVIDTAPADHACILATLPLADCFVIPLRPSPFDLQCIDAAVELADAEGCPKLVALNCTVPNSEMTVGARDYLHARNINVWDEEMQFDEIHASAALSGLTAAESAPDTDAGRKFESLFDFVEQNAGPSRSKTQARTSKRGRHT